MANTEADLKAYADKHRLPQLLQALTAHLLHYKPEDPIQSLISFLQQVQCGGDSPLLEIADFDALFEGLDSSGTGFITLGQVSKGLQMLGKGAIAPSDLEQRFPSGEISKNAFVLYMKELFEQRWAEESAE